MRAEIWLVGLDLAEAAYAFVGDDPDDRAFAELRSVIFMRASSSTIAILSDS
jgi:hypothetical protein